MGRRSSITQLPAELREAVDTAVREGRATIEELTALINAHGVAVSKSAVGRYMKRANDQMQRFRQAQEIAKVWIGKIETDPHGDVGRLLSEMLKTVAFQVAGDMGDESAKASAQDVMFLTSALRNIGTFDKVRMEHILKIRQETAAEAAKAAASAGKSRGLTPETIAYIRSEIYGIVDKP